MIPKILIPIGSIAMIGGISVNYDKIASYGALVLLIGLAVKLIKDIRG